MRLYTKGTQKKNINGLEMQRKTEEAYSVQDLIQDGYLGKSIHAHGKYKLLLKKPINEEETIRCASQIK